MAVDPEGCREAVAVSTPRAVKLLLVEDDRSLARGICAALVHGGYSVDVAHSACGALKLARQGEFDAGILDLGLPDRDGIDLLRDLRGAGMRFPILILSARDATNDRIHGLDSGADDYLVKPFALGELEARLRALLRRGSEEAPSRELGALKFDLAGKRALIGDEDVELTAREIAILEILLANAHRVVRKETLFDAVFPAETESAPNALEVHVSRLRHKLKPAGVMIRSVRGLGYRIEETTADVGSDP